MPMRSPMLAALGALTLVLALTATGVSPVAVADTAPAAGLPATVSADALPAPQINGVAWSQAVSGTTDFVGGSFTTARPAGAAAGTGTVTRNDMLAYDVTTGVLRSGFAPSFNGQVRGVAVSPDGAVVYAVGDFTTVNGVARNHVAAVNATTGALITTFAPSLNGPGYSVTAVSGAVYVGGGFTAAGSTTRLRTAAFAPTNGALLPFAPSISHSSATVTVDVRGIAVSPDRTSVVLGGNFDTVNGSVQKGSVKVDAATGRTDQPWAVNTVAIDNGSGSAIYSISSDSTGVYGTGYSYKASGGQGPLEGAFSASWSGGTIRWVEDCHGDTYSTAPVGSVLYVASHEHYCGNVPNGWQQEVGATGFSSFQRGTAFTTAPTGTIRPNSIPGYTNFAGRPAPSVLDWYPSFTTGTYTGQSQAAWSVAGNASYVVYGGEFPSVNGTAQQGLVRFAVPSISHKDGPRLSAYSSTPWAVRALSVTPATVRVTWPANYDRDSANLTYTLMRNGVTVYTTTASSQMVYKRPILAYTDTGLPAGSTASYTVTATDPNGNAAKSAVTSVTVATTKTSSAYMDAVLADAPDDFWRLDDPAGSTVLRDTSGPWDLTAQSGTALHAATGIPGDPGTAASFNGTPSGAAATTQLVGGTDTFTIEAWFRTTSTSGGLLVGMDAYPTGTGSIHDRQLYLDGSGHVLFTVNPGSQAVIGSSGTYRNGAWHSAVATLSPSGMRLYVDGALVATNATVTRAMQIGGAWRVGGDATPAAQYGYLNGAIDDVAVYNTAALSAARIAAHYQAGAK